MTDDYRGNGQSNGQNRNHAVKAIVSKSGGSRLLDRETAIARLGGDEQLFQELVAFFREDSPPLVQQIGAGIAEGDLSAVVYAAHTLKGLAANIGAAAVAEVAAQIEEAGRSQNTAGANAYLPRLERAMAELDQVLNS